VDAFQAGIAVKPSSLGRSQWEKLEKLQQIVGELDSNIRYLVIDSESAGDDIQPSTFSRLLESLSDGMVRAVLTLPVRRRDFGERLEAVMEIIPCYDGCGICLVAGNPAYLDGDERGQNAGRPLVEAAVKIRARSKSCLLLVGTENIQHPAIMAARKTGAKPFALFNHAIGDELARLRKLTGLEAAVYTPYYVGADLGDDVWRVLSGYVVRRGYPHDKVAEGLDALTMVGTLDRIGVRIRNLWMGGAGLVVGYPAILDRLQIKLFSRALEYSVL
jgi:hypothetical protein